jgi:hypothetical protein
MLDHGALYRVQPAAVERRQVLDSDDLAAVHCAQGQDAARHRAVAQAALRIEIGKRDRAGAAIALGAAFLGAGEAARFSQPREQRARRVLRGERDALAVQDEVEAAPAQFALRLLS